jgi:hypothetical protein
VKAHASARLSCVDLTAVAAFTAAALSLVNVVMSARLTSREHREQWRRDQERPIVARSLTLSDDALTAGHNTSLATSIMGEGDEWPDTKMKQRWQKGWQLLEDLRYEVAQLDLLASGPVRKAARELVRAHEEDWVRVVETKPGVHDAEGGRANDVKIRELQSALVETTRADLGLGPAGALPLPKPRSLIGKIRARAQE